MKKITGKELKKKIILNSKLLDLDRFDDFKQSHISNSINIPFDEIDFVSQVRKIVPNINQEVILCVKPYNAKELLLAAEKLEEEGYFNIYSHTLGRQDWKRAGIDIVELR